MYIFVENYIYEVVLVSLLDTGGPHDRVIMVGP